MPQIPAPVSVRSFIEDLLTYFSPAERAIPGATRYGNTRVEAAIDALNGALDEIHAMGPAWLYRDGLSAPVNAPANVTVTVTEGSKTFTPASWADWYEGCTIAIGGDEVDNEIRYYDPLAGTGTLRDTYQGTSGSKSATVYNDSLKLDEEVGEILAPVFWGSQHHLTAVAGMGEAIGLTTGYRYYEDYGADRQHYAGALPRNMLKLSASAGIPSFYWVENSWNENSLEERRIRLLPLPSSENRVLFNSKLQIPQYRMEDILHTAQGPVKMTVFNGTASTMPIATIGDANDVIKVFPVDDFKANGRASFNLTIITPVGANSVQVWTSGYGLAAGEEYWMWYEDTGTNSPSPDELTEGTILKFPRRLIQSVLRKVAAEHLRQCPFFRNDAVLPEIERGYASALRLIENARPQSRSHITRVPRYM